LPREADQIGDFLYLGWHEPVDSLLYLFLARFETTKMIDSLNRFAG
jgi:hypothetical protein